MGEHVKCAEEPEGGTDVLERGRDTAEVFLYVHVLQHVCSAAIRHMMPHR